MTFQAFVRRAHMYAGLFLAPWVLTIGVSALIIHNQPLLSGWPKREVPPQEALDAIRSSSTRAPDEIARTIVAALNARENGNPNELVYGSAAFDGVFNMSLEWQSTKGKVTFDPKPVDGLITRFQPAAATERIAGLAPAAVSRAERDALHDRIEAALRRDDAGLRKAGVLGVPGVRFRILRSDKISDARYDMLTGDVVLTDHVATPWWEFLHKLHMTNKYFDGPWYRWAWLVMANIVAVTLCFWVLSGLVMWWQLKPARRSGLVVLALALVLVAAVYTGMWGLIAA